MVGICQGRLRYDEADGRFEHALRTKLDEDEAGLNTYHADEVAFLFRKLDEARRHIGVP